MHQQAPPKGSGFVLASMHQRGWHELSTGCNMHALRSVRGIAGAAPHGRSLVLEGRHCTGSDKPITLFRMLDLQVNQAGSRISPACRS